MKRPNNYGEALNIMLVEHQKHLVLTKLMKWIVKTMRKMKHLRTFVKNVSMKADGVNIERFVTLLKICNIVF